MKAICRLILAATTIFACTAFANNSATLELVAQPGQELTCYVQSGVSLSLELHQGFSYQLRFVWDENTQRYEVLRDGFLMMVCESVWLSSPTEIGENQ